MPCPLVCGTLTCACWKGLFKVHACPSLVWCRLDLDTLQSDFFSITKGSFNVRASKLGRVSSSEYESVLDKLMTYHVNISRAPPLCAFPYSPASTNNLYTVLSSQWRFRCSSPTKKISYRIISTRVVTGERVRSGQDLQIRRKARRAIPCPDPSLSPVP